MILFRSDCFQNRENTIYKIQCEILALDELEAVAQYDHVGAEYQGGHRSKHDFLRADCLMMDIDNGGPVEVPPESWIYPKDVAAAFPGVRFWIIYSRNNMRDKPDHAVNGTPRPRFHAYFDFADFVTDESEYTDMKRRVITYFPAFDRNAKDSARFFYGIEKPTGEFFDGDIHLDEWLRSHPEAGVEHNPPATSTPVCYDETDRNELLDALFSIDCANYDRATWIDVGMALKHEGMSCAVWDRWSATDVGRYHPGECARKWNSFHGASKPVTAATIFYLARQAGWRPSRRSGALDWNGTIGDGRPTTAGMGVIL